MGEKVEKKELKNISFEVASEIDSSFDDERFIKMRLRVMHEGKNPNLSNFSDEVVEDAKSTIANTPILANIVTDENGNIDFGAHDITIEENKLKEGEYKLIYQEQPIGLIPETNNYSIEEFKGRNYVYVDGYIWRSYSNYAEDLVESKDETKLSMEIIVNDYAELEEDKNYFDVKSYKYTGITFLGDKYGTGMLEAKAEKVEFNLDENKEVFIKMAEELKFALENHSADEGEVETEVVTEEVEPEIVETEVEPEVNAEDAIVDTAVEPEGEPIVETPEVVVETEPVVEPEVVAEVVAEPEGEKFMLNSEKRKKLSEALVGEESTDEVKYYYWINDFDEKYVYFEEEIMTDDDYTWKNYRCEYSETGAEINVDMATKVEIFRTWLTQEEMDKLQTEREAVVMSLNDEIKELETKVESFEKEISEKDEIITELNSFKSNVEKEIKLSQVEEILGDFDSVLKDNDEYVALKESAFDMEIEDLEKELYALVGKMKHVKKKGKDKKANFSRVAIVVNEDGDDREDKISKYYGSASKYFKKK